MHLLGREVPIAGIPPAAAPQADPSKLGRRRAAILWWVAALDARAAAAPSELEMLEGCLELAKDVDDLLAEQVAHRLSSLPKRYKARHALEDRIPSSRGDYAHTSATWPWLRPLPLAEGSPQEQPGDSGSSRKGPQDRNNQLAPPIRWLPERSLTRSQSRARRTFLISAQEDFFRSALERVWQMALGPECVRANLPLESEREIFVDCSWHLVGQVHETRGGLRFRLDASKDGSRMRQLRPEDVAQLMPGTRLIILQGTPEDSDEKITESDRVRIYRLHRFAEELTSTIPAVLVIPPLPTAIALEVVEQVAAGIRPTKSPLKTIFAALESIRKHLLETPTLVNESYRAAAYDVRLWITRGWSNPFRTQPSSPKPQGSPS
jgi:hypothetical protein